MPRLLPVTSYQVFMSSTLLGFNEWRQSIILRSQDTTTSADVRFVDDPSALPSDGSYVKDPGWSQVYLPASEFSRYLEVLRTEKPLSVSLHPDDNRMLVQTGPEPPGGESH